MVKSVEDTPLAAVEVVENQTKPGISDHYSLMTETRRCVEAIKNTLSVYVSC